MIIVRNDFLPFDGYKAMTVWPFIFVRSGCTFSDTDMNHEEIHGRQQLEMLVLPFFLWYVLEWVVRLFANAGNAYRSISFEREAYANEHDRQYLSKRKTWSFVKYLHNERDC